MLDFLLCILWLFHKYCIYIKCLPQILIQSDYWKFHIFSRFIGVDWSLTDEDHFTIKSTEDLKLKYKPLSGANTTSVRGYKEKCSKLRTLRSLCSLQVLNCEDFSALPQTYMKMIFQWAKFKCHGKTAEFPLTELHFLNVTQVKNLCLELSPITFEKAV